MQKEVYVQVERKWNYIRKTLQYLKSIWLKIILKDNRGLKTPLRTGTSYFSRLGYEFATHIPFLCIYIHKVGYDVEYVKDGRELIIKIYDYTTHEGNPDYYSYGYEIISEYGPIVNYEFTTKEDFVKSNDKIDAYVVNTYLNKFPFKK